MHVRVHSERLRPADLKAKRIVQPEVIGHGGCHILTAQILIQQDGESRLVRFGQLAELNAHLVRGHTGKEVDRGYVVCEQTWV